MFLKRSSFNKSHQQWCTWFTLGCVLLWLSMGRFYPYYWILRNRHWDNQTIALMKEEHWQAHHRNFETNWWYNHNQRKHKTLSAWSLSSLGLFFVFLDCVTQNEYYLIFITGYTVFTAMWGLDIDFIRLDLCLPTDLRTRPVHSSSLLDMLTQDSGIV